ncbi:DUF4198 domain-containing protein [Blastopirellula sp. J2-11]|uniref:DUF4198 domain-containing protein n=1 Tax=Blastopirellula sp. J2-11 TaxID=2943192 RepID=UPI0021C73904|nr:DUF4198 domain-containing protein [Blastopirellula sp. J2-11]UUO04452.1 DUF4198 domain-containing protein [Blastopirellula sp. J2-11]
MQELRTPLSGTHACGLIVLALCLTGCSRDPFACVPVSGTVTLDGEPLSTARVIFSPQGDGKSAIVGPMSYCITDDQGRFELATPYGESGAVAGSHKISICGEVRDEENPRVVLKKEYLPARYWQGDTLTFDVPNHGTDEAHFALDSK